MDQHGLSFFSLPEGNSELLSLHLGSGFCFTPWWHLWVSVFLGSFDLVEVLERLGWHYAQALEIPEFPNLPLSSTNQHWLLEILAFSDSVQVFQWLVQGALSVWSVIFTWEQQITHAESWMLSVPRALDWSAPCFAIGLGQGSVPRRPVHSWSHCLLHKSCFKTFLSFLVRLSFYEPHLLLFFFVTHTMTQNHLWESGKLSPIFWGVGRITCLERNTQDEGGREKQKCSVRLWAVAELTASFRASPHQQSKGTDCCVVLGQLFPAPGFLLVW